MNQPKIYEGGKARPSPSPNGHSVVQHAEGNGFFSPARLVQTVLYRWRIMLLFVILGVLFGVLYLEFSPPTYKAEAELEMNVRRPKVISSEAVFDDSSSMRDEDAIFNTRFAKFRSPAMEKLATKEYFRCYPEDEKLSAGLGIDRSALALLIRDVGWYKDPKANIVRVACLNPNPIFAARLVNVLSDCAGLLMMQENEAQSDEAVKWLVTQVKTQQDFLENVEGQLSQLREDLHLDSLQQRKAVLDQTLASVSVERETMIGTLASRETVFEFVKSLQGTDPNLEVLPTGLPKEEQLTELIQSWRTAHEELLLAADRYTELHPEYRLASDKEARARKRLDQFIDLSAKSVQNEIELLRKQKEQLEKRIETMKQEALDLNQRLVDGMQQVQRLERERDAADTSYQSMLRRMEEARLAADENMAFTKVIREAEVPVLPVSPKKSSVLPISIILGGFVGFVIIIGVAFFTDKITSVSDLKALNLNIIGIIPLQKEVDSRCELATIGLRDRFNHLVEIFAGINALISSDKYISKTQVLMISSAMPGEGKTIAACNLAISSALNGSRTLLIDGDLRRPQLMNIFSFDDDHPSLLEWLMKDKGDISFEKLVSKNIIDNLDVIVSRPLKEINPAELLGRNGFNELLQWARSHYDRVIIDTPPIGAVGDGQVLANLSDSVIMVSRVGVTRRRTLRFSLSRFNDIDAPVLGCIANDVPNTLASLFDGAEGYGYGYGYSAYRSE